MPMPRRAAASESPVGFQDLCTTIVRPNGSLSPMRIPEVACALAGDGDEDLFQPCSGFVSLPDLGENSVLLSQNVYAGICGSYA